LPLTLLHQFQNLAISRRREIELLWLALWPQPDALAGERIFANLHLAIDEELKRVADLEEPSIETLDNCKQLRTWQSAIDAIQQVFSKLPPASQAVMQRPAKDEESHPLTRIGLIAHSIYSAFWNCHESMMDRYTGLSSAAQQDGQTLRRLQLLYLQFQSRMIDTYAISLKDYEIWFQDGIAIDQQSANKSYNRKDFFSDRKKFYPGSVGHALRALSRKLYMPLLVKLRGCLADEEAQTLLAISELDTTMPDLQVVVNAKDRSDLEQMVGALRGFARKVLDEGSTTTPRHRRKGGTRRKGRHHIEGGYIGKAVERVPSIPPEEIPELDGWVQGEDMYGVDDDEIRKNDDDTEAPRKSGLTLIRPADVAGKLAKLKAQQHHMAVLRQSFGWDSAALADSEKQRLNDLLENLKQTVATEHAAIWMPRAMVAVSWLVGRTLAEVEQLRVVLPDKLNEGDPSLTISQTDHGIFWGLSLRTPAPTRKQFSKQLAHIDRIRVPDVSGLGAAIFAMHERRGTPKKPVFAWTNPPQQRIDLAIDQIRQMDEAAGGLKRIVPGCVARGLRIELLNLVPDRTIAWMIAGTRQEANESRMFYAAHTAEELINWTLTAQIKLLSLSAVKAPACQMQTLTTFAEGQAEKEADRAFAGARFMPTIERLQRLTKYLRHFAQQLPPEEVRDPGDAIDIGDGEAERKHPIRNASYPFHLWDTIGCWRLWHDELVRWVWLVQGLQTGMRAVDYPSSLYYQWLMSPDHPWGSPEDKTTRHHDESRAVWVTPLLRDAFQALTATQEAYAYRWKSKPSKHKSIRKPQISSKDPMADMPVGFVVFDGGKKPHPMRSSWAVRQIKREIGADWPANFPRALLRRALAERGLSGDDLDAFLGHGALADRVHDGHSLFEPMAYFDRLKKALSDFAESVGLKKLNHRLHLGPETQRYKKHRKHALDKLKTELGLPGAEPTKKNSKSKERTRFDDWCDAVAVLTEEKVSNLAKLKNWHAILEASKAPFAQFLLKAGRASEQAPVVPLQVQNDVDTQVPIQPESASVTDQVQSHEPMKPASQNLTQANADALEQQLIAEFMDKDTKLKRTDTAYGFNLAYRICQSIDPTMPTMKLALTPAAKVSPYTFERIRSAAHAEDWLVKCRKAIRGQASVDPKSHTKTDPAIELALASFLNVTTNKPRWMALARTLTQPVKVKRRPFAAPFEYQLKGLGKKDRQHRGFLDAVSLRLPTLELPIVEKKNPDFKRMKPKIANRPRDLGAWTTGLRWWSRLRLPPLVAEHFAGVLDDQCASGPWGEQFADANSSKFKVVQNTNLEFLEQGIVPPLVVRDAVVDPFGWVPGLPNANTPAGQWLRSSLSGLLGGDPNAGAEDLSEALDEAMYFAPSSYRQTLKSTIAKICKNHGLDNEVESESGDLHVERQVIDLETYHRLLDNCAEACIKARFPERQSRLRLLLVLGFRFGMRRREILGLRRIDVDLIGSGRIHIRAYPGHTLKTNFSRRSLPIAPLLTPPERDFLARACQGLGPMQRIFPDHEHDTLAREAIARLRQVAGDDSLKLHHLRHSFASLLALKLVLARHEQWIGAFAPWPQTTAELSASRDLVGSLIKPVNAAGDCLVIPRLLGHSSLQVSLTHYAHTLDIVAVLFQCHGFSKEVLHDRDVGPLTHMRFQEAQRVRRDALVWSPEILAQFKPKANVPAVLPRSKRLDKTLFGWLKRVREGEPANVVLPKNLTVEALGNWFSPRHAVKLQERLILATDKLSDDDVDLLSRLGDIYWQASPPMFWFSQARCKPGEEVGTAMVNDVVALIKLLRKCGFKPGDLVTWRNAKAAEKAHEKFWRPALVAAGVPRQCQTRSSRSSNTECLGISLSSGNVKRTELLLVWWLGLRQGLGLSDRPQ